MFAAKMAGRRFRDGPTHDGYRDLHYDRRFRPQPPSSEAQGSGAMPAAILKCR
jgi:hypothetical protein